MAARRSNSRSRSGGRRPSRAAEANNNVPIIIGVGVVVVVILIIVIMNSGADPKPQPKPVEAAEKKVDEPEAKSSESSQPSKSSKVLKDPDRAAPGLTQSFLDEADAIYTKAKKLNDDARRAQNAGKEAEFNKLINDSWDELMKLDSFIETYTDWLEEADMEEWKVPSSYRTLQSRMSKWDGLKGRVKRIKPNRR